MHRGRVRDLCYIVRGSLRRGRCGVSQYKWAFKLGVIHTFVTGSWSAENALSTEREREGESGDLKRILMTQCCNIKSFNS